MNVKCNNCNFIGNEEDLFLIKEDENENIIAYETPNGIISYLSKENVKNPEFFKGCPKCLTDSYLQDLIYESRTN